MSYAWKIVAVTFVTHFISIGFVFYSYAVFFTSLTAEFGGSRFGVAVGLAILNVVNGCFAPFLGRELRRRSIRNIMCIGAISMAIGFFLISRIGALWQFYAIVGSFLALGAAMLGALPSSTLIVNWFVTGRSMALGIATMGISMSGMIMAPVGTLLIGQYGWRSAFVIYGFVALILVVPLVWMIVVNRPEDVGLLPIGMTDGGEDARAKAVEPTIPLAAGDSMIDHAAGFEWSSRRGLVDRNFWVITMTVALNFCANGAILVHIVPHAEDLGFSRQSASFVLSACAGAGVVGKFLFGWITERIDKRSAFRLAMGFQAIGCFLILHAHTYPALMGAGAVFGLGMGGIVPIWGTITGAAFGREQFSRITGLMMPCMLPIMTFGVPFAGYVFDRQGNYDIAFRTFVGLYLAAIGVISMLRLPDVEPGMEPTPGG